MRVILVFLLCSSAVFAQVDSVFTEADVFTGKVIWAMPFSLVLHNDTSEQMAIPTKRIDRLVLENGEVIIGPGVPNKRYYQYIDTFDVFPSGIPDTLRASLPAPGTLFAMLKRSAIEAGKLGVDISERSPDIVDIDGNTSAVFAQAASVFTEADVFTGKVIWAMPFSLVLHNDTCEQMVIPTERIERLVLESGEVIIGPGVPNKRYYKYIDTFDVFLSGTPDTLRASLSAPGTLSAMSKRSAIEAGKLGVDISERGLDIVDIDGNTYRTMRVGSQTWMAENLRVAHYRDGTPILLLMHNKDWTRAQTSAMALYDQKDTYGKLYNWYAVTDPREVAPNGWHIPSDAEWIALEQTLGMNAFEAQQTGAFRGNSVGGKLSGDGECWERGVLIEDYQFASSQFTALPGGYRGYLNGTFSGWGKSAFFWSSSAINARSAWYRSLNYNNSGIYRDHASKQVGFAIRCIKDLPGDDDKIDHTQRSEDDLEGYAPSVVNRIMNTELWRGMTTEMARLSLGEPEKINRTEYNFTIYERWLYPHGKCLFFESGLLSSWEDESF